MFNRGVEPSAHSHILEIMEVSGVRQVLRNSSGGGGGADCRDDKVAARAKEVVVAVGDAEERQAGDDECCGILVEEEEVLIAEKVMQRQGRKRWWLRLATRRRDRPEVWGLRKEMIRGKARMAMAMALKGLEKSEFVDGECYGILVEEEEVLIAETAKR
nr:hypothetical protein CFP56_38619 [Quercus suber]